MNDSDKALAALLAKAMAALCVRNTFLEYLPAGNDETGAAVSEALKSQMTEGAGFQRLLGVCHSILHPVRRGCAGSVNGAPSFAHTSPLHALVLLLRLLGPWHDLPGP